MDWGDGRRSRLYGVLGGRARQGGFSQEVIEYWKYVGVGRSD